MRSSVAINSHLLSTTTVGHPEAPIRSASRWSWWVTPAVASMTSRAMSARSRASSARSTEKYSVPRSVRDLAAHAGGVDEADGSLGGLHHGVDGVAGGAGGIVGDRALVTDQPVEQGRLPDVGPADQRHPGYAGPGLCRPAPASPSGPTPSSPPATPAGSGSRRTTSSSRSPVPRPCRALMGHGGPKPEGHGVPGVGLALGGVDLVDHHPHRPARTLQHPGDGHVLVDDARR